MEKKTTAKALSCGCCGVTRREFLTTGAASALAIHAGMESLTLAAGPPGEGDSAKKPPVQVAFVRPAAEQYFMKWPGEIYDIKARTADYTKVLNDAAKQLDIKLDIHPQPLWNNASARALIGKVKQSKPLGVILILQHLGDYKDRRVCNWVKQLAGFPTVVFSPMGTSFHDLLTAMKAISRKQKVFYASTPDHAWLAFGMRLLDTIWQMRNTRICVVQKKKTRDIVLDTVGTTLHYIPFSRFAEEYAKVKETGEVRAMAAGWQKNARKVIEPTRQHIVDAAKTYVVCRRLMKEEGCQGIAVDCLPHVAGRKVPPPCMAFSHLNDEGTVASCQADWPAAISLRLTYLLLGRPGFMNNMCSSSVNNTLIGAHCTSPVRLAGPNQPPVPYTLRTHSESDLGVAPQVLWPVGEKVTVMKFNHPRWSDRPKPGGASATTIRLGSGRVVRNIDTPPAGGCRTSVEVRLDGVDNIADVKMLHHMLYVLGDQVLKFKAYCEAAGVRVESLTA